MPNATCTACGAIRPDKVSGWWRLHQYFGLTGLFCGSCYGKVSHDAHGRPRHPRAYHALLRTQYNDTPTRLTARAPNGDTAS